MKRLKWREVLLLCLPVLVVASVPVAQWWRAEQQRKSGPLRVVVSQVRWMEPTPRQIAGGVATVWRWSFKVVGNPTFPTRGEVTPPSGVPQVSLSYARRGMPNTRFKAKLGNRGETPPANWGSSWTLLVYNSQLPSDAFDFRIEGRARGGAWYHVRPETTLPAPLKVRHNANGTHVVRVEAQPQPISISLPPFRVPLKQPTTNRSTHLRLKKVEVFRKGGWGGDGKADYYLPYPPEPMDIGTRIVLEVTPSDQTIKSWSDDMPAHFGRAEEFEFWGRKVVDAKGQAVKIQGKEPYYIGTWVGKSPQQIVITGYYKSQPWLQQHPDARVVLYGSLKNQWPVRIVIPLLNPQKSHAAPMPPASWPKPAR